MQGWKSKQFSVDGWCLPSPGPEVCVRVGGEKEKKTLRRVHAIPLRRCLLRCPYRAARKSRSQMRYASTQATATVV